MKRLGQLLGRDLTLSWRNYHVAAVIGIAALMIALIIFLPSELNTGPGEYFLDTLPGRPVRSALLDLGGNPEGLPETRAELDRLLEENSSALGLVIEGSIDAPQVEVIQQTSIPRETVNLLIATVEMVLHAVRDGELPAYPVQTLRPQAPDVPLNLAGIPIFLVFEVAILGFLLVAVFVFQEKQEGTIRAYRVSPGGLWPYLISKVLVFTLLGLVYGVAVVLAGFGLSANWPAVLALTVWASAFMTVFGLGFAAWFDNLSHWFFPGLAVLVLNMLPFFSYVYPVFSPAWITVIPSYGLVFAVREALFPTGDAEVIRTTLLTGLIWLAGGTAFGALSVRARLLRGA